MNKLWINKTGNTRCILFFNGWGMDTQAVSELDHTGFDICQFNNHCNPSNPNVFDPEFVHELAASYQEFYLVAWSLGVWAAATSGVFSFIPLHKSIALNGTINPINALEGIAPEIFEATLQNWDERNRTKFNMRVFGGRQQLQTYMGNVPQRGIEDQKIELFNIQQHILQEVAPQTSFSCALIGSNDAIFSAENQQNYWHDKTRTIATQAPHFPFGEFTAWSQIIAL